MKTIRVLIADDEPLARDGLALLLSEMPGFDIVANCADGESALASINETKPDLALLDVQMPQLNGLEVYHRLPQQNRPAVVFITAYQNHAVRAFDLSAVDYIVKPFSDDRFRMAVARARERILQADIDGVRDQVDELASRLKSLEDKMPAGAASRPKRIALKIGTEVVLVAQRDILLVEASGESVQVRVEGQTHTVRSSLAAFEADLDPQIFVRIHRSFIVNAQRVRKLTPTLYGDYDLWLDDGTGLRMSRTYRDQLPRLMNGTFD